MLGHNYTNNKLAHPYYGTRKVINDLKKYEAYNTGKIIFNDKNIEKIVDSYNTKVFFKHSSFKIFTLDTVYI